MAKYLPDMRAGDDYNVKLVIKDVAGVAKDITGYKFWLTLKASISDADAAAALQFSTTAGDNVNDDIANGICYMAVPAIMTKGIIPGEYRYDIQQRVGTALSTVLPPIADYKDKLIVIPEITRAI